MNDKTRSEAEKALSAMKTRLEELAKLEPKEVFQLLIDAGIIDAEGHYLGPSKHHPI